MALVAGIMQMEYLNDGVDGAGRTGRTGGYS